jgi:hypothetical protein
MATTAMRKILSVVVLFAAAGCMGAGEEPQTEVKQGALACGHSPCKEGGPLSTGCGSYGCVATICSTDSFCCTTRWDATCVSEMASCPRRCDCSQVHTAGVPFYPDASPCTTAVYSGDTYCSDSWWDNVCVAETYLPVNSAACSPVCQ